ncbi:hypothetical protein HRTV-17_gp3 [Halorubrum phage HRTV-17]|uniref:Uncharacterized protein n=2 Tax=Haloferacalesvirus hv8 TaxID=1273755 RepID=A0AAE9BVC4_9CAUD|nr:hypothetical protein HRTV-14_gp3 [Halorubrum phage HRTV-14]UBF19202.1 hypothetical protein HRTV-17_gp3 [Halorubrum phage HRTV-17]UBF19329.1 hypothetical protein HRTV-19_gp3 [Halorubrum virus HRTV-19]UBF19458.1 hypothetical protein HRTV-23_gp3 [Halorubrum virus HRTV-23]
MPELTRFSRDYDLVLDAEVHTWREEEAHMDVDLYEDLALRLGEPIIGMVGGVNYQFRPSTQVLRDSCAVPRRFRGRRVSGSTLLVRR